MVRLLASSLIGRVCHVTREPPRPVGAQQHDGPGAAAHQELSPRQRPDPEGGGATVCPRKRHRLQRLRGAGPHRPGQGEAPVVLALC